MQVLENKLFSFIIFTGGNAKKSVQWAKAYKGSHD
jgi:hypothetical protein